ncbi:MAG: hypothetical protein U9O98_09260 [Asgard group archaeon]|nr:hypothetical protein [Asgard group archaeon]
MSPSKNNQNENNSSNREMEKKKTSTEQLRVDEDTIIKVKEEISPKKAAKHLRSSFREYTDYRTVPNRRKTDITFRENLSDRLNNANDILKEIHAILIEKQQMSTWAIAEKLIDEISSFSKEVKKGDYGFTTFFQNPKILEMDISQLHIIDFDLLGAAFRLKERIEAFNKVVRRDYFEDIELWFETIDRLVGWIIRLYDDRVKLIGAYERIS